MDRLSERQYQIIDCRCRCGLTNHETAVALHIAPQTVKNHVCAIIRKFPDVQALDQLCYRVGYFDGIKERTTAMNADEV